MKITDIQVHLCEAGYRNWLFVEIHTDEGVTGVGEGTTEGQVLTVKARIEEMGRYLLGKDPQDISLHTQLLTRDPFWVGGYVSGSALAALEMAMWDISGKKLGVPLWRLWGGRIRDRVRAYANGWYFGVEGPEDWGDRAGEVAELGYTAMKFDPFGRAGPRISREELDYAQAIVREVRRGAGPGADLLIEAHGRFDIHAAIQAARAVEPFDCFWYEEPVIPGNHAALRQLADAVSIPVATGERVYSRQDARELLELHAATVLQCDVCHCGGLEEIRKIAAVAETYSVAIAPHNPNGPVATAACLAIDAVTPNFMIQEMFTPWDVDWRDTVVIGSSRVVDGYIEVPDRPGLGVELVHDELAKHPFEAKDLQIFSREA
jgi:galactonate dehydratase